MGAGSKFQLEDWEYVTCMKHLYLSSEGMHRQDNQPSLHVVNISLVFKAKLYSPRFQDVKYW